MANPILSTPAYLSSPPVQEACSLVADLCRLFYPQGWVTGTGGSITVKVHDDSVPKSQQLIIMSPSGVQKERMEPQDMYVMSGDGNMLIEPSPKPYPHKAPKCTDCGPLFMKAYTMRDAGAVIHSHGMESCIVTMMNPSAKEFKMTHMEMIKGIKGYGYRDELVVPIIENQPQESELTDSFAEAIEAYPKATAVLVRNHGIFVWGDTWISAKTQAECYHYLFDAAIRLYQLGIDWTTPDHGHLSIPRAIQQTPATGGLQHDNYAVESSRKFIVLDIEGTTTPISFVTDVLFPYARDNVRKHLISTFDNKETKEDIELLQAQVEEDCKNGVAGAVPIPPENSGRDSVIDAIVTNVEAMIKADRKITSLKQLQGHIWRTGYECKDLLGIVFEDVPGALKKWHSEGKKMVCQKTDLQVRIMTLYKKVEEKIRLGIFNGDPTGTHLVYIYSSGSREAQRLIFGNTSYGDLRRYLCGFFDTTVGNKKETRSYLEIAQSLGVDNESEILFVTDVYQEAVAAKAAGFEVLISIRPGNAPLPSNHGFKTITSFVEI